MKSVGGQRSRPNRDEKTLKDKENTFVLLVTWLVGKMDWNLEEPKRKNKSLGCILQEFTFFALRFLLNIQ